jgi:hypothetical protein
MGVDIEPASLVVPTSSPSAAPVRPRIISPLDDPEDAAERSCSLTRGVHGSDTRHSWLGGALLLSGLAWLRQRRRPFAA